MNHKSEPIAVSQVTSLSVSLVKYLALITRYLPDRSEILQHLKNAGISFLLHLSVKSQIITMISISWYWLCILLNFSVL